MLIRRPLSRILGATCRTGPAHRPSVRDHERRGHLKCLGAEAWARRQWEMLTVKISENSVQMREWTSPAPTSRCSPPASARS